MTIYGAKNLATQQADTIEIHFSLKEFQCLESNVLLIIFSTLKQIRRYSVLFAFVKDGRMSSNFTSFPTAVFFIILR